MIVDHIIIASTTLIGSYAFVRGFSLFGGHYPNEFTLADLIKKGLYTEIDPIFYAYFAAIVIVFIGGALVQYKIRSKDLEEERHPYHNLK